MLLLKQWCVALQQRQDHVLVMGMHIGRDELQLQLLEQDIDGDTTVHPTVAAIGLLWECGAGVHWIETPVSVESGVMQGLMFCLQVVEQMLQVTKPVISHQIMALWGVFSKSRMAHVQ